MAITGLPHIKILEHNLHDDLLKIKLARIAGAAAFWMSVGTLFIQEQGLSTSQAYTLISCYYLAVVILEFPTGVIGDHFSHKTALVSGYIVAGLSMIAMGFGGGFLYLAICLLGAALGISLTSGSDTALTHHLSKDFKKDQSQAKFYITLTIVTATSVGSLLAMVYIGLPTLLTGCCNLLAAWLVWRIKSPSPRSQEGNVFRTALSSLGQIRHQPVIGHLLVLTALSYGFILAIKWLYNPLLQAMSIPLEYWGVIMGASLLVPLLGIKVYQHSKRSHLTICFILFCLSIVPIGWVQVGAISIAALYLTTALTGYIDIALDVQLNQVIQTTQRASILSLSSLLSRLLAAGYLPAVGLGLQHTSYLGVMAATGSIFLLLAGWSLWSVAAHRRPTVA